MESVAYNFASDESRLGVNYNNNMSASQSASLPECITSAAMPSSAYQDGVFGSFQGPPNASLLQLLAQQEPNLGDEAPSSTDLDEIMACLNLTPDLKKIDETDHSQLYGNTNTAESIASQNTAWSSGHPKGGSEQPNPFDFRLGAGSAESFAAQMNNWNDANSSRQKEQMIAFDFLARSVSAANSYVSMLSRDQVTLLQSLRPSVLYDFLNDVAKARLQRRSSRRLMPSECAFCKNNGENEECYASHTLKDWRGRVLCPVLRAFRCPRCGATGDRAHTIKYCPENSESASDRSSSLSSRRRFGQTGLQLNSSSMPTPLGPLTPNPGSSASPSPSINTPISHNNLWNSY